MSIDDVVATLVSEMVETVTAGDAAPPAGEPDVQPVNETVRTPAEPTGLPVEPTGETIQAAVETASPILWT